MRIMPRVRINGVYQQLENVRERYMIIYGGRRSSKSWSVSQLLVRLAIENRSRHIFVLRKYATTIRLSVWARIKNALSEFGWLAFCDINKTDREIRLPNGSVFHFIGADDPEKMKSVEEATDYWLEEGTEFTEADFDTLDAGLSAPVDPPPQMWLTFNPIPEIPGYQHWIQRRWFNGLKPELGIPVIANDACILRTWYQHNFFCPLATIRVLERYRETNPELWQMWGLGLFTRMQGAILKNWDCVDSVPAGMTHKGFGLDFGFALDPAAVVETWMKPGELWIREKVYATDLTNPELSDVMESVGMTKGESDISGDSAEPKSIQELEDLGWLISAGDKAPNYKAAAALWLKGLQIHVVGESPNLKQECAMWSWKRKAKADEDGNISYLPVPQDGNDHCIDATIYRVFRRQEDILKGEDVQRGHSQSVKSLYGKSTADSEVKSLG